jgi:excisionase family DNA binding protein
VTTYDAAPNGTDAHAQPVAGGYSRSTHFARVQAISRKDAAETLGVSIGTVDNMTRRGELEAYKVARCTRIPESEIVRLLGGPGARPVRAMTHAEAFESDHPRDA